MTPAVILVFLICPPSGAWCEDGFVIARTCARAEAFIRAGLRPGQTVEIHECRPYEPGDWKAAD